MVFVRASKQSRQCEFYSSSIEKKVPLGLRTTYAFEVRKLICLFITTLGRESSLQPVATRMESPEFAMHEHCSGNIGLLAGTYRTTARTLQQLSSSGAYKRNELLRACNVGWWKYALKICLNVCKVTRRSSLVDDGMLHQE